MTGVAMALAGSGGAAGAGGVVNPGALAWSGIYDTDSGTSNTQAFTAITSPISVSAALSGGGVLYYNLNGGYAAYTGAFAVHAGDTLSWTINVGHLGHSGNLTVTNVTTATVLATIPYSVQSSWTGSGYR
jgi:hypothetical protein